MPGISRKGRRSTKSRPYERRRRTRRHQRGGDAPEASQQTLDSWLAAARDLHEMPPGPALALRSLQRDPALTMMTRTGVMLPEPYSPPYLGDIMTSVALGLGQQRIQTGVEFTNAMGLLKTQEPMFYDLLVSLETTLRRRYQATTGTLPPVDLSVTPTDNKTPFVWIAYANLPNIPLEPAAPTLFPVEEVTKEITGSVPTA